MNDICKNCIHYASNNTYDDGIPEGMCFLKLPPYIKVTNKIVLETDCCDFYEGE